MIINYSISEPCELIVIDTFGEHWTLSNKPDLTFQEALTITKDSLDNGFTFVTGDIKEIIIISTKTGEVLAECYAEKE